MFKFFKPNELNEVTGSKKGAKNYKKWVKANKDKLNPDGSLKAGWVRNYKTGELIYDESKAKEAIDNELEYDYDKITKICTIHNNIRDKYTDAENYYKEGKYKSALTVLNTLIAYIKEIDGQIIGLYIFLLLINVKKEINGKIGAIEAYDEGIKYYSSVKGDNVERWFEQLKNKKVDYIKEVEYLEYLQKNYNFNITPEIEEAITRLENIKVNDFRKKDFKMQNSFGKVWYSVLDEVLLFEKDAEDNKLNKTTYKGAKSWLRSFAKLCNDKIPDEYLKTE